MLREVIGAIMTAAMATIVLWFILPMLHLTKESIFGFILKHPDPAVSQNPTTLMLIELGDMVFLGLSFMVFLIAGYVILNYATRKEPFEF